MARLGGWKRIGIIVSVVWILGVVPYIYNKALDSFISEHWSHCLEEYTRERGPSEDYTAKGIMAERYAACGKLNADNLPLDRRAALEESAFVALTLVLLGWGLAYLILFCVNWVKRGFISPRNSN